MPGFGESLRSERESRNVTIEKIADETGIGRDYLEALERNEFQGLPGRAFGKLYIRAYARMLGFDPQPLIDEYDRDLQRAHPVSTESAGPGSESSRPAGSIIASWRQARIAERNKLGDDVGVLATEEAGPADESGELPVCEDESALAGTAHESDPGDVIPVHEDTASGGEHVVRALDEAAAEPGLEIAVVADDGPVAAVPDLPSALVPAAPAPGIRSKTPVLALLVLALLMVLSVVAVFSFGGKGAAGRGSPSTVLHDVVTLPSAPAPSRESPVQVPRPANPPVAPRTISRLPAARTPPVEGSAAGRDHAPLQRTSAGTASLSVTESGLGRRIVDHRVDGQDERFPAGTVVWFQTRALGGEQGDAIRHVWIHDGRAVQSIRLRLGGPDWRTQSSKTLRHVGPWAVEARDKDGRVLARADFVCEPSAP